jgi:hypothetical protein
MGQIVVVVLLWSLATTALAASVKLIEREYSAAPPAPAAQSQADADAKSAGCLSCHTRTDRHTMHANPAVVLGCTDCHGGNASIHHRSGIAAADWSEDAAFVAAMGEAHVLPRNERLWRSAANPEGSFAHLNREHAAFVRFINPGDLRIAREACGACHLAIIESQERSLMSTSAMLWGGAAYNNGILPFKRYLLGEAYTADGQAAAIRGPLRPDEPSLVEKGILEILYPLPAWETVPPADPFRVFERGGRVINSIFPEVGLPNVTGQVQRLDEPGRPDIRQSNRGPGTGLRISIPVLNLTKTRLNDPHLWFLGTNDNPGDFRSSGCTACHVVYANDRDPRHSGPYAEFGNLGKSQSEDPTIPKDRSGHPLKHEFTRAIPSSQCMVCHMHQPNVYVNSFYGYMQYDYEPDAPRMFPAQQHYPSDEEMHEIHLRNPEEAVIRGNWREREFLNDLWLRNDEMRDTQFADYHGHGWVFRAVHKRDRKGRLLDAENQVVAHDDPDKFKKAVHMSSIHLDVGMHCVDCHFSQDMHGNGHIYGEVAAAIEIDCADCHGTARQYPTLHTSGPAARPGGMDMSLLRTPDGRLRFEWIDGRLFQRASLDPTLEWEVSLVRDSVNPAHPDYNSKAARAKLMAAGDAGRAGQWGPGATALAHDNDAMACYTCHTSWTTSCAGCHLPVQANRKTERLHYEGRETRNYATYNVQVARDDVFQLGIHGPVKNGRIVPFRSSSALVLSSQNTNRERIYYQQPPISSSGFSSQAFAPHYAHTERLTETKTCTDCHVSEQNDNNALMAQLLLHGTNFVNFVGRYAWIGSESHIESVGVTEWDEPQAVLGSYLHKYAYPDWYADHLQRGREIGDLPHREAANHLRTRDAARCLQMRGEYLFVAEGKGGMRVYDIAGNANKGVSQRIIKAPFSPLGHDTHVRSRNATCVALPTNQPIAPTRNQGELMRVVNQEQPFHPVYHYAYVIDAEEGLILVEVGTLVDGEARNNFLERALTWNPDGLLNGARHIVVAGSYAYIAVPRAVHIIDLTDPLQPTLTASVPLDDPRAVALQFRYLYVTDATGLRVIDVTDITRPLLLPATVPMADAQRVYLARTYAYVAAGAEGLAIVDIEVADQPRLYQLYDAEGTLNDARDVVIGTTNASLFAYVADGRNGLKVLQLTSPESQPGFYGFSPEPKPELIATRRTRSAALALSKGLDRDRAVDETGHQIAVIGRIGARPFNRAEMEKLYLDPNGVPWRVTDRVDMQHFLPGKPPAEAGVR